MGELDRGKSDSAASAMNQKAFTRLKTSSLKDVMPDGEDGLG